MCSFFLSINDCIGEVVGEIFDMVSVKSITFEFYYDTIIEKNEEDFLIDDYSNSTVLLIEVKSGKDYAVHSALNNLLSTPDYHVQSAIVISNEGEMRKEGSIIYMPSNSG